MTKAYLVVESEILDPIALGRYVGPVREALVAAGGWPAIVSSVGRRIIGLIGKLLVNLVISEWDGVAAAKKLASLP